VSKYYELGYAQEIDFGQGDAMRKKIRTLQQAPKNAGPINSHMLVLRSLELMCDISPDYLDCFMSYAETLLCPDLEAVMNLPGCHSVCSGYESSQTVSQ
jgi:hypothetical protein